MDSEIEVTSAAKCPEIEVTSAAKGPEIEVTSAAKGPEIEVTLTSAAGDPDIAVRRSSSDTIFRAPAHIRYRRESDFEPKLVSIGPYHHGRENLQPMEVTKTRFMSDLLKMSVDENQILSPSHIDRVPVDPFMKFGSRARSFYKEKFDHCDVDFVRMLVLDSCFIILIMLSLSQYVPYSMAFLDVNVKEVRSDLLLLENQIPLFFIKEVYAWLFRNTDIDELHNFVDVLESFICLDLPWNVNKLPLGSSEHLLDFYWRSSESKPYDAMDNQFGQLGPVLLKRVYAATMKILRAQNNHSEPKFIANATELHQMAAPKFIANATELHQGAGIKFEKRDSIGLQVKFLEVEGILWMPCLRVDSSHTTLLVNLIAYENMSPSIRIISTYIKFMDDLIDSEKDVELLQKSGVIYKTLSSHSMAATYFNDMGNFCFIGSNNNRFSQLFEDVEKYYESRWNRWWAGLRQYKNRFESPWAVISVSAAVFLLFLSGVQTYYTVFP